MSPVSLETSPSLQFGPILKFKLFAHLVQLRIAHTLNQQLGWLDNVPIKYLKPQMSSFNKHSNFHIHGIEVQ